MNDRSQNLRKAAILVSCLTNREADELLDGMDPSDATRIRATLVELEDVSLEEQEQVLAEFLSGNTPPAEIATDGVEMDLSMEGRIAAEDPTHVTRDSEPETSHTSADLDSVACDLLARALADEHPQTIAVMLARQAPERASQILMQLPLATQADVARRLRSIQLPPATLLHVIDTALMAKLNEQATKLNDQAITTWDQILDAVEPDERQSLLQRLTDDEMTTPSTAVSDHDVSGRVQEPSTDSQDALFSFADLVYLEDTALLQVLSVVEQKVILLALTGAPRELVDRLLAQVSADEARLFEQRCESIGPLNLRDVEFAQQTITDCARRMAQHGQIQIPLLAERRAA